MTGGLQEGTLAVPTENDELRSLGDRFDIREFHDQVLGAGSLPLDVLEQRINAWIKTKKL